MNLLSKVNVVTIIHYWTQNKTSNQKDEGHIKISNFRKYINKFGEKQAAWESSSV